MKKLLATIMLSTLAVLPATSAWAGGSGPSTKGASATALALQGADESPTDRELYAWGCQDHHLFVLYGDVMSGLSGRSFEDSWCGDNIIVYA